MPSQKKHAIFHFLLDIHRHVKHTKYMRTTSATVAERTENAVVIKSILTVIPAFSTGQAAFNWARKNNADNVTVLVKRGHRAASMLIRRVGEHYEGR